MRTIVVDDEKMALVAFMEEAKNIKELDIAGVFDNAKEAVEFIKDNDVELAILDVKMKGIVGYDLLPENVTCLKQGTVSYLIGQRPGLQGYYGIMTLCNHVVFKLSVPAISYMPIDLLMKENIDYYFEKED